MEHNTDNSKAEEKSKAESGPTEAFSSQEMSREGGVYQCNSCTYQTEDENDIQVHTASHDASEQLFKCPECSFKSPLERYLNTHITMKHMTPEEKEKKAEVFKCDVCSFQTIHKYSLKNHLTIHMSPSERNIYKCDECSYACRLKQLLIRHKKNHVSEALGNFAFGHFLDAGEPEKIVRRRRRRMKS